MTKEQFINFFLKQSRKPPPTCRPRYKFKTRISKRRRSLSPKPTHRSELPPRSALLLPPKFKRISRELGHLKDHYKPKKMKDALKDGFIEYKSEGSKFLIIKEYFKIIRPYLKKMKKSIKMSEKFN